MTSSERKLLADLVERYGKAAILKALARPAGRPKNRFVSLSYVQLADAIDNFAECYRTNGHAAPQKAAFAEAAAHESHEKGRDVSVRTIERYYRIGVASRRQLRKII